MPAIGVGTLVGSLTAKAPVDAGWQTGNSHLGRTAAVLMAASPRLATEGSVAAAVAVRVLQNVEESAHCGLTRMLQPVGKRVCWAAVVTRAGFPPWRLGHFAQV